MGTSAVIFLAIGLLLEVWLLLVIWKRRLFGAFPFFSIYILATVLIEVIKLAVVNDYLAYFKVFWSGEVLYAVLALLALHEAFNRLFEPFLRIYSWFRFVFPTTVLVFSGIPVLYALARPPREASPAISLILSFALGVNILQCGLFLVFLVIKQILSISTRTHAWGIVEGFAATALAGLTYAARSEFGTKLTFLVKYGPPVAYIFALLLWLDTFIRVERNATWNLAITPAQLAAEVAAYTRSIKRLLERRR